MAACPDVTAQSLTTPRWAALAVVVMLLLASVVAAGMMPDPSWIDGVYDALDGDEALSLVWERGEATSAAGFGAVLVASTAFVTLPWLTAQHHPFVLRTSSRAPPLS